MAVTTSPFVGRERELAALRSALDDAARGAGRVAVLAGKPGIGKTRTAAEVATAAGGRQATVLWGTCYERESRPYGVWIDAFIGYIRDLDSHELSDLVGPGASVLAEVAPELAQFLGDLPSAPRLEPADSRLRVYEAWARALRALPGAVALLVLDDLHWADPSSLELLRYVGCAVRNTGVIVLCTYRDIEVDLQHPLADCLAELDRHGASLRLPLQRLDATESGELVEQLFGERPPTEQEVGAIVRETEGNPFFIAEVVRHVREGGVGVPETIRQAVASRLVRLSPDTVRALSIAAAFTRPFDFAVLQALTDFSDERLLVCIDEALHAGMLQPVPAAVESYEFAHALVRQSIYDELSPSRKIRLHRRIAQALERVQAGRELEYAAELAHQYRQSASLPGAEHGLRYALAAAEQARRSHAPAEAATFLRIARDLSVQSTPASQADVLCRLALAEADALELEQAARTADDALEAFARAGADPPKVAEFLGAVGWALKEGGASDELLAPIVRRGLALVGDTPDLAWARLMLIRLPLELRRRDGLEYAVWRGFDPEAIAIARASGDEREYARTLEPMEGRTRVETDELLELVRGWSDPAAKIHGLTVVARELLYRHGAFRASAEICGELLAAAESYGSLSGQAFALVLRSEVETALGDFVAAGRTTDTASELIGRLGSGHRLRRWRAETGLLTNYVGGDWAALAQAHTELAFGAGSGWPWMSLVLAGAALARARASEPDEAERLLEFLTPVIEDQETVAPGLSEAVGEAAAAVWELGLSHLAERYRRLALALIDAGIGDTLGGSNALTVGRMSALLGRLEEASRWFARAREELERSGQRPLRAIVDYDEVLAGERGALGGSSQLLDIARAQFETLGMTFWLERAEKLEKELKKSYPHGLTVREAEVLRLVAAGRSNKEIAAELVLSVHTIERHLANVYAKIGARNRADAAAFAVRHQL